MKILRRISSYQLSIAGLFALALFLLVWKLGMRSFWTDEWYGFRFFDMGFFEYLTYYWKHPDNHPPLFYAISTALVQWIGKHDFVVRVPGVIGGVWAFIMSGFLIKQTIKEQRENIMFIALAFIATAPYLILIGQTARYFSLAAGAGLTVLFALLKLIEKPTRVRGLFYGFSLVLAGYIDYPTLLYVVMGSASIMGLHYYRTRGIRVLKTWFFSSAVAALLLLPLAPIVIAEAKAEALSGPDVLSGGLVAWILRLLAYGYGVSHGMISGPLGIVTVIWIVAIIIVAAMLIHGRNKKFLLKDLHYIILFGLVVLLCNTFVFAVLERYSPIAFPRYALMYVYLFFIVLSALFVRLASHRWVSMLLVTLVLAAHMNGLFGYYDQSQYVDATFFGDSKEMFEFVKDNAEPGDALLISDDLPQDVYNWYKDRYFEGLVIYDGRIEPPSDRIWVVAIAHDTPGNSMGSETRAAELVHRLGDKQWHITKRNAGSPLSDEVVAIKNGLLPFDSYIYKVGAFLIERRVEPIEDL